jgi:hypothetical protein
MVVFYTNCYAFNHSLTTFLVVKPHFLRLNFKFNNVSCNGIIFYIFLKDIYDGINLNTYFIFVENTDM